MDYTHYLFAAFVFALLCATIYLNYKLKTPKRSAPSTVHEDASEKEMRLLKLYQNLEEAMRNLEDEIGESKKELQKLHLEACEMLESCRTLCSNLKAEQTYKEPPQTRGFATYAELKHAAGRKKNTRESINELLANGYNDEKIARELSISKGEVEFAKGLIKEQKF